MLTSKHRRCQIFPASCSVISILFDVSDRDVVVVLVLSVCWLCLGPSICIWACVGILCETYITKKWQWYHCQCWQVLPHSNWGFKDRGCLSLYRMPTEAMWMWFGVFIYFVNVNNLSTLYTGLNKRLSVETGRPMYVLKNVTFKLWAYAVSPLHLAAWLCLVGLCVAAWRAS